MDKPPLKILLSAYSCGPGRGSEPGVGWNAALAMSTLCEVHVLTTHEFKVDIERLMADRSLPPTLHFHFFDIPGGPWWWRHGKGRGIQFHYALWQWMAGKVVRNLHRIIHFDAAQHVTLVRYWAPSCLRNSGIPYVFGPVAGADLPPKSLIREYPLRQRMVFAARRLARWMGERNPATLATLRNAAHVFAATPATLERCRVLGVMEGRLSLCQAIGLCEEDIKRLAVMPFVKEPVFFGIGQLRYYKRYDLAIRAFAAAAIPGSRLVLIGGGPEETKLRNLAALLGVADRLEITGFLTRTHALAKMAECSVMLHPSNLESGGSAVMEALAAGRPVIALDIGGPALLLDESRGMKLVPSNSESIVDGMVAAMRTLVDPALRSSMRENARRFASDGVSWPCKAKVYVQTLHAVRRSSSGLGRHALHCLSKNRLDGQLRRIV